MMKRIVVAGGMLAAALAFPPAGAQVLYKSVLPDGRVVYGDKPDPGAAKVEEQKPDISKRGLGGSTPREAEALKAMEESRAKRETADEKSRSAQDAVRAAEQARAAGKEPLAGERTGTAGGGSRLNDSYYERQRKLEEDVEKARRGTGQTQTRPGAY
jgi:uncharacterized protein DUF4124